MTVRELMATLEGLHPDARVLLAVNRRWPWEHDVAAVIERKHIDADDRDEHWERDDVLLLEGNRVGFGPIEAWDDASKRAATGG